MIDWSVMKVLHKFTETSIRLLDLPIWRSHTCNNLPIWRSHTCAYTCNMEVIEPCLV